MLPPLHPKELRIGFGAPKVSGNKTTAIVVIAIIVAIAITIYLVRNARKQKD